MKIAVMQPYFAPYIGYFQLWSSVDAFVVYDDIEYTKKGWINRNRILVDGQPAYISLPLLAAPDTLIVRDRQLAKSFPQERVKILRRIEAAYRRAPFFAQGMALAAAVLECNERNLFDFIHNSLQVFGNFLGISTPLVRSSTLHVDRSLRAQCRVIMTCRQMCASEYVNPPGGRGLYQAQAFEEQGIALRFLVPVLDPYPQFGNEFVPALSILDLAMFQARESLQKGLRELGDGCIVP